MYQRGNEKWKWFCLICALGLIGFFLWQNGQVKEDESWMFGFDGQKEKSLVLAESEDSSKVGTLSSDQLLQSQEPKLAVHIAGAIQKPGVYYLPQASRVVDLIKVAGGVLKMADLNQVNLAQLLRDGQKVVIPLQKVVSRAGNGKITGDFFSSGVGGMSTSWSGIDGDSGGKTVNINAAGKEELQTLSGVGPSRAETIIQYRIEHGPFRRLEDLTKISGIGEKTFAKLKDQISLY